jgi:hypothetical protein
MEEYRTTLLPKCIEEEKDQQQIQLKLSTIFKQKVVDAPRAFGSFYAARRKILRNFDTIKVLRYDIAAEVSRKFRMTKKIETLQNYSPYDILEMIDNFAVHANHQRSLKCFGSRLP